MVARFRIATAFVLRTDLLDQVAEASQEDQDAGHHEQVDHNGGQHAATDQGHVVGVSGSVATMDSTTRLSNAALSGCS